MLQNVFHGDIHYRKMSDKKLAILGSGPGGYIAAIRAAQLGCSVTVIEKNGLGGVCLQSGCIPTKALLKSANVYEEACRASAFGVKCPDVDFDFGAMISRKDDIVAMNEKGIDNLFKKHGIALVHGTGKLVTPSLVHVTGRDGTVSKLETDAVIIATGSSSIVPSFITLDNERIIDNEGALSLNSLPDSIVVLGGGVLGCEFASLFNSLGAQVTIVEQLTSLIPSFDHDLSRTLTASLRKKGDVRTNATVVNVTHEVNSCTVKVSLDSGETVTSEYCLVALGRHANTGDIGLEEAGIGLWAEKYRGIRVNEYMQTNIPSVYAIGDVTGIRPLAHVASAQGITAAEHICGIESPMSYNAVPDCCFASPEIGSVGLTGQEAREKDIDIDIGRSYYRSSGISYVVGETDGFVKVIAEKESGKILGIHICGHNAAVMSAEASVIVGKGLTVGDIKKTIHAHPTVSEILKEAVLAVRKEQIQG